MGEPQDRRSFLRWACHGLGAVFAAVLGVPAALYLIDPRNRSGAQSKEEFRPVTGVRLTQLRLNAPEQGVIRDVRRDAWTLYPSDVVGRVWVVRVKEGRTADCFKVFTTVCPHLGCSVNCHAEAPVHFKCPCHGAEFNPDGTRVNRPHYENAAPRDMDSLEFQVAEADPDILLVHYQNFVAGEPVKKVRS